MQTETKAELAWATEAVELERAGTRGYYVAAVLYAEQWAEGWSARRIAEAVAAAGFPIGHATVSRRLKALEACPVTRQPSTYDLEVFAEAYAAASNPPEGEPESSPHQAEGTGDDDWNTPADLIAAAREVLGGIDLDPASNAAAQAVVKAETFYDVSSDGLLQPWAGRVWMNPPYSQPMCERFCGRLVAEHEAGRVTAAIALTNNATETGWWQELAGAGSAWAFPRGRVRFWKPDVEAVPLQGQALVYLGEHPEVFRDRFADFGLAVAR